MRKITVKPSADVAAKWGNVTPGRQSYYESATPAAGAKWEAATIAAAGTFKTAVSAGNIQQLFSGGVKKAGAAKFSRKVTAVGVGRFGPGVQAAITDFQTGVDPFLATLAATPIPDKAPRGTASNYLINAAIGDPLHKKRLALLGAVAAGA